ncbi:uncharacterized protein LOC131941151 [Physella acuta]|uniref:uncharacterized protein LOC131941151 n=1 Tax=Physella acuta TaxID=109671 RepID=UPI0027DDE58F|nr:uncharacterized protein LOC131941151 [Physella acuta]
MSILILNQVDGTRCVDVFLDNIELRVPQSSSVVSVRNGIEFIVHVYKLRKVSVRVSLPSSNGELNSFFKCMKESNTTPQENVNEVMEIFQEELAIHNFFCEINQQSMEIATTCEVASARCFVSYFNQAILKRHTQDPNLFCLHKESFKSCISQTRCSLQTKSEMALMIDTSAGVGNKIHCGKS